MKYPTLVTALFLVLTACCAHKSSQAPQRAPANTAQSQKASPNLSQLFSLLGQKPEVVVPDAVCGSGKYCVPSYSLDESISEEEAEIFTKWLDKANALKPKAIVVLINTHGGSVDAGYDMIKAIEDSEAPVTCLVDIRAYSMGFAILQACDKRLMTKRSALMAHEIKMGGLIFGGKQTFGNIQKHLEVNDEAFSEQCAAKLKISLEEYRKRVAGGRDWFMAHKEAVEVGAVDGVAVSPKQLKEKLGSTGSY
jgi:ATP-dependent protease ClpP protease subunit